MVFTKQKKPSTFFKYLLSYILIFTILMAAFFLILRSKLTETYSVQRNDRIKSQMEAVYTHMNSEIAFLSQIDKMIKSNPDIKLATYQIENKYLRVTGLALNQYVSSCNLINSIVYYSRFSGHVFSTASHVTWDGSSFHLFDSVRNTVSFDPAPYLGKTTSQLILLRNGDTKYLVYFPENPTSAQYIYFYILDMQVIQSQIMGLLSEEVPAVALLDAQGNCVTGYGLNAYASVLDSGNLDPGIRPAPDNISLFVSQKLQSGFSLAAVVSEDYLARQVDRSFLGSFFSLLGLSVLGVVLVYVAMLFTYRPLQRLIQNLGHEPGRHQNYLEMISRNHRELTTQKDQLEQTLAEYRETLVRYREKEAAFREYPHGELNTLSRLLEENRFTEAGTLLEGLLTRFEQNGETDYFLGCILLDSLTVITNSMSQAHIEFDTYRNVFTEAVRKCRDIQHLQDAGELRSLIHELLFFYEKETVNRLLHTSPLRQMVAENFCDPNFSISVIAAAYHVSDSRMSTLFKEELGIAFTECVWQMRLERAQQLLRDTQMSLEEISFTVGYLAHSSFSRKFKQATGMTPTQYRAQFTGIAEI